MKYKQISVLSNKKVKVSLKSQFLGLGAGRTAFIATLTSLHAFIALFLECLTILINVLVVCFHRKGLYCLHG